MEKLKTTALIFLVGLSLLQSYFLVYRMPGLAATMRSDQDYVNTEPMGASSSVESLVFPEKIIIHLGENTHTVLDPGTQFYDMILKQRIVGREFKGFQRGPESMIDWDDVRKNDIGLELRFSNGIAVELLQKLLKLEGDLLFLNEKIDRIWIYKVADTEEVRTFFFSSGNKIVYESVRADLTVRDVQDYVGFGQYLPKYEMTADGLYIPTEPIQATEMVFDYEAYSPEQMQRNFFDPSTTLAVEDRSGSLIYTDGKRGLQVEQNGMWINYTNPAASQSTSSHISENVYASIEFINQHGGWDGVNRLVNPVSSSSEKYVTFRKYIEQYPVIELPPFRYGYMKLTLQQGVVTEYARSLITLSSTAEEREARWLPGGQTLKDQLKAHRNRKDIVGLFPALKAMPIDDSKMSFVPVWAIKLKDGSEQVLMEAYPAGFKPGKLPSEQQEEADKKAVGQAVDSKSDESAEELSDKQAN
ncbi:YycH family regulatory protein [Paenibacillus sp. IITD108]|uniref:YycH family regulatory protein n=1 Tax=Paenibacillus sp. IITD108 TaxID=3116649 RepID=UPI002F3E20CF